MIAITLLVPESRNPNPGRIAGVLGPILAGPAVLVAFCLVEAKTENPSLDVRLFRDRRLSAAAAAIALNFFAMAGVFFFMSFYLQNVRGFSPLHAGLLSVPVAVGQVLAANRSAGLVRRFGAKAVATAGLLVVTGAIVGFHSLTLTTSVAVLEAIYVLQGIGMGIVVPTATESVMSVVPRERGGAGSAITNTARQVAVALGVAVLGSILAQAYRARLWPYLSVLPRAARYTATQSIAATQAAAAGLGPHGASLLAAANRAFVASMHVALLISALVATAGAAVMAIWLPGRRAAIPASTAAPGPPVAAENPDPADAALVDG